MLTRRPAKEAPADVFWRGCVSDMKRIDANFKFRNVNHEEECKKSKYMTVKPHQIDLFFNLEF